MLFSLGTELLRHHRRSRSWGCFVLSLIHMNGNWPGNLENWQLVVFEALQFTGTCRSRLFPPQSATTPRTGAQPTIDTEPDFELGHWPTASHPWVVGWSGGSPSRRSHVYVHRELRQAEATGTCTIAATASSTPTKNNSTPSSVKISTVNYNIMWNVKTASDFQNMYTTTCVNFYHQQMKERIKIVKSKQENFPWMLKKSVPSYVHQGMLTFHPRIVFIDVHMCSQIIETKKSLMGVDSTIHTKTADQTVQYSNLIYTGQ